MTCLAHKGSPVNSNQTNYAPVILCATRKRVCMLCIFVCHVCVCALGVKIYRIVGNFGVNRKLNYIWHNEPSFYSYFQMLQGVYEQWVSKTLVKL